MEDHSLPGNSMYQPLPNTRHTRILRVMESTPDQDEKLLIRLTLLDIDTVAVRDGADTRNNAHDKNPDDEGFDALSYTWGAPLDTTECEQDYGPANDVPVAVTLHDTRRYSITIGRNLYEALLHIWSTGRRRTLWVDALCVNQQDPVEKSKHILLMRDIYSKADLVLVWLGHDDLDSPTFDHILWLHNVVLDQIDQYVKTVGRLTREDMTFETGSDGSVNFLTLGAKNAIWIPAEALRALYRFYARRRYLSRAWIVQEIALSRDALALIGPKGLHFPKLGTLFRALRANDLAGTAGHFIEDRVDGNSGTGNELHSLIAAVQQRESYGTNGPMRNDLSRIYGAHDDLTLFLAAMEYHMATQSHRRATDPRDLIYSLLGMIDYSVHLEEIPVRPDYTKAVDQVFLDFTVHSLLKMPHRTILSLIRHPQLPSGSQTRQSPSWVPRFDELDSEYSNIHLTQGSRWRKDGCEYPDLASGADDAAFSSLEITNGHLILHARRCGKIVNTFRLTKSKVIPRTLRESALRELEVINSILETCVQLGPNYFPNESTVDVIFRTLCIDTGEFQSEQERHERLKNLICLSITEPENMLPNDTEVMAEVQRLAGMLPHLSGQPGIPTSMELLRYKRFVQIARDDGPQDFKSAIQELWPDLNLDDDDSLGALIANLLKRTDVRVKHDTPIFTTDTGLLGYSMGQVQEGDEVWLICQAKVPFVLRPTEDGKYLLIVETFVHGAMFGELIKNGVAGEPQLITIV